MCCRRMGRHRTDENNWYMFPDSQLVFSRSYSTNKVHFHGITINGNWHLRSRESRRDTAHAQHQRRRLPANSTLLGIPIIFQSCAGEHRARSYERKGRQESRVTIKREKERGRKSNRNNLTSMKKEDACCSKACVL